MVDRGIALAKGGDTHALGSLLERSRAYLRMLVRVRIGRRLQSKIDADDLLQEAFLRAHQAIDRFRGSTEDEFLAWLRGILSHVLADQVRRYHGTERRNPKLECALDFDFDRAAEKFVREFASQTSSPSQRAVRHERALLLAQAMDRLPPASREILTLRHFQALSFPEIARHMDRTLDAVKNLWIRALGQLRREMASIDELD